MALRGSSDSGWPEGISNWRFRAKNKTCGKIHPFLLYSSTVCKYILYLHSITTRHIVERVLVFCLQCSYLVATNWVFRDETVVVPLRLFSCRSQFCWYTHGTYCTYLSISIYIISPWLHLRTRSWTELKAHNLPFFFFFSSFFQNLSISSGFPVFSVLIKNISGTSSVDLTASSKQFSPVRLALRSPIEFNNCWVLAPALLRHCTF